MKTFQMRMKKTVKTIENQRVSDLSTKRHRSENIPNVFFSFDFFRFLALCDFFFENFWVLSKSNPLHFFVEVFGL